MSIINIIIKLKKEDMVCFKKILLLCILTVNYCCCNIFLAGTKDDCECPYCFDEVKEENKYYIANTDIFTGCGCCTQVCSVCLVNVIVSKLEKYFMSTINTNKE